MSGTSIEPGEKSPPESFEEVVPAPQQAAYQYETQELYAARQGNQIYGVIYIPQNAGEEMPAVIFSHGFGGTHSVGTRYAQALASNGYVVYCFDF